MKKPLLIVFATLFMLPAFAQIKYDIEQAKNIVIQNNVPGLIATHKGHRVYFDYASMQYLYEAPFQRLYGTKTVKMLDKMYANYISNAQTIRQNEQVNIQEPPVSEYKTNRVAKAYKLKLSTENLVIGTSIIGASAAAYMVSNSIISAKAKTYEADLSNGNIETDEYKENIKSLDKSKRTIGYVCAGTSIIGIITILSGLYKEYEAGINVGQNITVSDAGGGISITKKF